MWKLLRYMKGYLRESVCAPAFKLLEAGLDLIVPLVMARIIDVGIAEGDGACILRMCLLMAGLGALGLACSITAQYFSAKAAVGFSTRVRHELFAHIQALSFTEADEIGTSTLITRMTSDINQVQSGVNLFLRLFLRSPFIVFGSMVMAFTIDVRLALIFVVMIPVLCVIVFGIMLIGIPLYRRVQERLDAVTLATRENLEGVRVIRAFCREPEEIRSFQEKNHLLVSLQQFSGRISALMNPMTYAVVNAALAVLLFVGARRVDGGILLQGSIVALVNYLTQILVELVKLANLIITVTRAIACGDRIEAVLEVPAGMDDIPGQDALSGCGKESAGEGAKSQADDFADSDAAKRADAVTFDQVSFRYRGAAADALTDLTFSVRPGETIGIIGSTGSGKTSLVSLIPRFYDVCTGSVRVFGRDVREYPLEELRRNIGIVMQKPVLFSGTIRSNLLWGNEDATEEELLAAVLAAQAEDILAPGLELADIKGRDGEAGKSALVAGLDLSVEQEGRNFSGGQKQRLTIARALVRRPKILILDDCSSALDFATDAHLRRSIRNLRNDPDLKEMTVLIVSQRTSSVVTADRIFVLEDGRIIGDGTHRELLKTCEVYREIHEAQFPPEEEEGA